MKKFFTPLLLLVLMGGIGFAQSGLVINEIDYDQPGVDSAEFIELYNAGTAAVNLADYNLILSNCNNNGFVAYATITLPAQSLAPGAFFVLCSPFGNVPNCNQTFTHTYSNGYVQNGAPDAVYLQEIVSLNTIDIVSYEGTCASPYSGIGIPLAESDTVVAQDTINGVPQAPLKTYGISRYPDGNDTNVDSIDFRRACITPGAPNTNQNSNCNTVGLFNNNAPKLTVMAYPNPSRGIINLDLKGRSFKNGIVHVYDMLGNELRTFSLKSGSVQSLDLTELMNGIYFIKVQTDLGSAMQRIVLKK